MYCTNPGKRVLSKFILVQCNLSSSSIYLKMSSFTSTLHSFRRILDLETGDTEEIANDEPSETFLPTVPKPIPYPLQRKQNLQDSYEDAQQIYDDDFDDAASTTYPSLRAQSSLEDTSAGTGSSSFAILPSLLEGKFDFSENNLRKYNCPEENCCLAFLRKDCLDRHIATFHRGIKIGCPHDGCEKLYRDK